MVSESTIRFRKCSDLRTIVGKYRSNMQCCSVFYYPCWFAECVGHEDRNKAGCKFNGWPGCQCHRYHYQTSLIAGTTSHNTRHNTRFPLNQWFPVVCLPARRRKGISALQALQLLRETGVICYNTARKARHKLVQVVGHQNGKKLSGYIAIEDVCLSGELSETQERGSCNKIPFVTAVDVTQDGGSGKMHLRRVRVFSSQESPVMSNPAWLQDALFCLVSSAVSSEMITGESGCEYPVIVTGSGYKITYDTPCSNG